MSEQIGCVVVRHPGKFLSMSVSFLIINKKSHKFAEFISRFIGFDLPKTAHLAMRRRSPSGLTAFLLF